MMTLDYDDVLIRPIPSTVNSRSEVDISVKLSDYLTLDFPVIASPMRGIVNAKFAKALSDLGGLAILHRFYDTEEERAKEIRSLTDRAKYGIAIGMNDDYMPFVSEGPDIICVDVANGYTIGLLKYCEDVSNYIERHNLKTLLMSGNVVTHEGVINLRNAGVQLIRVGIGSGGLCITRQVTGIGVPQISAIQDCFGLDVKIVADGGIRSSGDGVKAFVAGADVLMIGSLFAQTYESDANGTIYGMASRKLQEIKYTQVKSVEGIEKAVTKKYPLAQFVDEFSWGIKSAGTYLNARNLEEIYTNGEFVV